MIGIYKITSPSGKIYIGQSKDVENRWDQYKKPNNYKGQVKLYRSIIKYGIINHNFEIIENCLEEKLNERERYWQDYYDVLNKNIGLNCVLTKTDILPRKISDHMKLKASERMKKVFLDKNKKPLRLNTGRKYNIYDMYGNILHENMYIRDVLTFLNIKRPSSVNINYRKNRCVYKKQFIIVPIIEDYYTYLYKCISFIKGEMIPIYQIFKNGKILKCTSSSVTKVKSKVLNSKDFTYYSKKNDSIYTFIGLINNAVQIRNNLNY
jgi:hypothetical protein